MPKGTFSVETLNIALSLLKASNKSTVNWRIFKTKQFPIRTISIWRIQKIDSKYRIFSNSIEKKYLKLDAKDSKLRENGKKCAQNTNWDSDLRMWCDENFRHKIDRKQYINTILKVKYLFNKSRLKCII